MVTAETAVADRKEVVVISRQHGQCKYKVHTFLRQQLTKILTEWQWGERTREPGPGHVRQLAGTVAPPAF